jgi:hypothetical protein
MPVKRTNEILGLILLLILGLATRLAFITRFPTIPASDFHSLILFGRYLHDHGLISNGWFWEFFNPGLPLLLYSLFRIFPGADPVSVARLATVLACGLLPILPFLIWRGVLPFWVRLLAGASLALWPGQILFSGVVAQDNWVLLPAVALGALAVRSLLASERAWPVTAGLLYAAGVAIRQEMLIVLFPLLFVAAGVTFRAKWRRVVSAGLAAGLPLVALAAYRGAATGRFSLSTEHGGIAILGAYVPGATPYGWIDPFPFIASVRPDLLYDREALLSQASLLAFRETLRRPGFHTARMLSSVLTSAVSGEGKSLYWSLDLPEVLPAVLHEPGEALTMRLQRPLRLEMAAIQGLFVAAVIVAIRRRNRAILALAAAVLLKYGLHAITAAQGRYFFVATALEILAIAVAVYEIWTIVPPGKRWLTIEALAAGLAFTAVLIFFAPWFAAFIQDHDIDQQRTYHFPLVLVDRSAMLSCLVDRGVLDALVVPLESTQSAAIRTFQHDPAPGEAGVAVCELTGSGEPRPLKLQVLDSYAPGGLGGRMVQRVEVDGAEVLSHDIAQEPGTGWANIPLGLVGTGTRKKVVIEVRAIRPDPGADWSDAARTTFQLVRPD